MKAISEIIDKPLNQSVRRPMGSDELTKDQASAVGYFFVRLKMLDPLQYDTMMPDTKTEGLIKREHAAYLKDLTREKIDAGFAIVHEYRQSGDPDFKFLNIDRIVGVICGSTASRAGMYKLFSPIGLPDITAQERAKEAGAKELERLKGLFDE